MNDKLSKSNPDTINKQMIGSRLRSHRKKNKLTLKQVSEMSGVALSTLSKMELGQAAVSYDKLEAAARSIGLSLNELFTSKEINHTGANRILVSTEQTSSDNFTASSYQYHPLFENFPAQSMLPMHVRITARDFTEYDDYHYHSGEEFVVVLSGKVRIIFENGEEVCLKEKESAYFDSSIGHLYLSDSELDAELISVMCDIRN